MNKKTKLIAMLILTIVMLIFAYVSAAITKTINMNNNVCHIIFDESDAYIDDARMAYAEGTHVVLGKSGTYVVSGKCSNGALEINTADTQDINLIFDGLTLNCTNSAPLNVMKSGAVYLELKGSNRLTDGYEYEGQIKGKPNACIYSKKDLHIGGEGSLEVVGNYHHGISVRADMSIDGGNVIVSAPGNAIDAKKSVNITGGNIALVSYGDGISVKNNDEDKAGDIVIAGGHVDINSHDKGIKAAGDVTISGGNHVITSEGEMILAGGSAHIKSECVTVR